MDYSAEEHFVQTFIRRNRRERLLYELTSPKKRVDGVSRFCHQAREFLDPDKILLEGEDLERRPEFAQFVRQHDELCLVLSLDFWPDEPFLPLKDAVVRAIVSMDAVLILGSTFALVFSEPMKGGREKYLLSEG